MVNFNTYLMLYSNAVRAVLSPTGLSLEEVREYERAMQEKTNSKVKSSQNNTGGVGAPDLHCTEIPQRIGRGWRGRRGVGERRENTAGYESCGGRERWR